MNRYRVVWTEQSRHERVLSAEELAVLCEVTVQELPALAESGDFSALEDGLGELDDGGCSCIGLTREVRIVRPVAEAQGGQA